MIRAPTQARIGTRSTKLAAVAFILAYLLFLVVGAPASWLVHHFGERMAPFVLHGVDGTAVAGDAQAAYVGDMPLGRVNWHLTPRAILRGCLGSSVTVRDERRGTAEGELGVCIGGGRYLRDTTVDILAARLERILGQESLSLGGRIDGSINALETDGREFQRAEGRVRWNDASFKALQSVSLGEVTFELSAAEGWLTGAFKNSGGDLGMDGVLKLKHDGAYELDGSLTPLGENISPDMLAQMAKPGPDGSFLLKLSGRL